MRRQCAGERNVKNARQTSGSTSKIASKRLAERYGGWFPPNRPAMFASTPTPPVWLTLLGSFELRIWGREVTSLPKKACALLAYLALQDGRPAPRDAVADLLWTDRGAEQARHSLRQTLLVLRRTLREAGEVIESGERSLRFVPGIVASDYDSFRHLINSSERGELSELARLSESDLLDRFPPIATEFDEWLAGLRERASGALLDALGRLADLHVEAGELEEVITVAERMVGLDPLREDLHRRLMAAYANAGRRSDAIRQYQACLEMLRRELGVQPATETTALIEQIRFGVSRLNADWRSKNLHPIWTDPTGAAAATSAFSAVHSTLGGQPERLPAMEPPGAPGQQVRFTSAANLRASIVVIPFSVRPDSPDTGFLSRGITEGVVHMLSGIGDLLVIGRGTSLTYAGRNIDPRHAGQELGVRYVLSGSVQGSGDRLRVYAELVETESGRVVRTSRHDIKLAEVFDLQDEISQEIIAAIAPTVRTNELSRAMRKHPSNLNAYDLLLRGLDVLYRLERDTFDQAGALLYRAIELDPGFASAHSHAATWHNFRIGQGWSPDIAADAARADSCAIAALELDPSDAAALAIRGQVLSFTRREYESARRYLDHAIQVGPSSPLVWALSSATHSWTGNGALAVQHAEHALRLSPLDPFAFFAEHMLSQGHYVAGDHESAVKWGRSAAARSPMLTSNFRTLAAALVALDRLDEAREIARRMLEIEPGFSVRRFAQRTALGPLVRDAYAARLRAAGLPD